MKTFRKLLIIAALALASVLATGCHFAQLPGPPGLPGPIVPVPGR